MADQLAYPSSSQSLYSLPNHHLSTSSPYSRRFLLQTCANTHARWQLGHSLNVRTYVPNRKLAKVKESPPSNPESLFWEQHKYFDQVIITIRAGDGGHRAILSMPNKRDTLKSQGKNDERKTRKKTLYKRDSDGSLILPMGGHGGDVVIYADESKDSLLEFHKKKRYSAKRGRNVDAIGALTSQLHDGFAAPALRIPVPVGTVLKHKPGKLIADLGRPGAEVFVSRGGQGGLSTPLSIILRICQGEKEVLLDNTTGI